ncbi:hypothetical protein PanWU01x14_162680 [Parasponia andersonii]|uniref:Transmembrane protein n=1 Tax=Parasponia andersonii TaxID=3476 RepID=A0A2P5CD16_PARAD|nr:hypothetical protein PanWU01x14_162680 [Parasponia andersonii]
MHKLMFSMGRKTLIHLLLACLLLAATQCHYSTITVEAIEPVHFRFKPAKPNSRSGTGYVLPATVDGKKIHKKPSGPNPAGNHRPPSRK